MISLRCPLRSCAIAWSIGALGVAGIAASAAGCSGAESQDVLSSSPSPSATSGATSGGTSGGTTSGGTSGGTTSGGLADGGGDASVDGPAPGACTPEGEPNDIAAMANVLAPSRCGNIQPNSESDFLTFQVAPSTTSLQITFQGKVELKVSVDGQSVTLREGAMPPVPFVRDKRYLIEIKSLIRGASIPWRVDLVER